MWYCDTCRANSPNECTCGLRSIMHTESMDTQATIENRRDEIDRLRAELEVKKNQLPAEMQDCTITFNECALGHGWLSATNWIQHPCPTCELAAAKSDAAKCAAAHINAVAACNENARLLMEARRQIDEARRQLPVAWAYHFSLHAYHDDFFDNEAFSDVLLKRRRELSPDDAFGRRGIDFDEKSLITEVPLYAAPVPAQPAAVPAEVARAVQILRKHNEWRRGADNNHWQATPYSPAELGRAIDTVCDATHDIQHDVLKRATQYAHDLVTWLHRDHYADNTTFEPFDDLLGLLSQIDNMICGWKPSAEQSLATITNSHQPAVPDDVAKDAARQSVWVSDICNAYESGVGHAGRPTAKVNPYREGTYEHEAYATGANGVKGSFSNHALLCELLPVLDEVMSGGVAEDLFNRIDSGQSTNTEEGKAWIKLRAILSAADAEVKK